jgi:hypothetical protein
MLLGPDCRVEEAPLEAERAFWDTTTASAPAGGTGAGKGDGCP